MTGDEMEHAIESLFENVAELVTYVGQVNRNLGARIEETNAQVAETSRQLAETNQQLAETNKLLRVYGETQSTFIEVVKHAFEEQAASISVLAAAQARTDERLNALINVVEKHIGEGGHGRAP